MPGEEVFLRPRYHWIRFLPGAVVSVAGACAVAVAFAFLPAPAEEGSFSARSAVVVAGSVALLFGLVVAGLRESS